MKRQTPLYVIQVGHRSIPVRRLDREIAKEGGFRGDYDPVTNEIRVDATLPPDQQAEVLLHELLHALWDDRDLEDKASEEAAVTALAKGLCAMFVVNSKLPALLLSALEGKRIIPT